MVQERALGLEKFKPGQLRSVEERWRQDILPEGSIDLQAVMANAAGNKKGLPVGGKREVG